MSYKKEAYYFSHDANAMTDPKCELLIQQLGMEGYGIFWGLVETLRNQPDYRYPIANIPALARKFNTTPEKVQAVVYNYGLFVVEDDKFFYSISFNRRMDEYNSRKLKRSIAGSKGNEVRWGLSQCGNNAIGMQSQSIASKGKESKIKEIKKESIKRTAQRFTPPSLDEVSDYISQNGYKVRAASFMNHYDSNGWKVGKNSMKDWKAAVRKWNTSELAGSTKNINQQTKNTMKFNYEELEKAVLGALMAEKDYMPEVMNVISNSDVFTLPQHKNVFEVMCEKYGAGEPIDLVTLSQTPRLRSEVKYLIDLTQSVGTGLNCVYHSQLLVQQYMRRKLSVFAMELQNKAQYEEDVADVLAWSQLQIDDITNIVASITAPKHISKVMHETLNDVEARCSAYKNGEAVGIPTGLTDLDRVTGGWRGGQIVVVAGRPAMGKSAVMLHFAKSAAKENVPVVIFSLEMQGKELGDRLIMGDVQIDPNRYKVGDVTSEEWKMLENANGAISRLPLSIADSSAVTMQKIRAQAQQLKTKGKCGMIIIDYLQLLDMQNRGRSVSREQEVSATTRQAKVIAKELNIPIILLSQLSRKVEDRADKTPMLSDLRESGAIEQDADIVVFIHRPYYYDKDTPIETSKYGSISPKGVGVLTVAKQRNGRTGQLYFKHSADLNNITDFECNYNETNMPY